MLLTLLSMRSDVRGATIPYLDTEAISRLQAAVSEEQFFEMVKSMNGADTWGEKP